MSSAGLKSMGNLWLPFQPFFHSTCGVNHAKCGRMVGGGQLGGQARALTGSSQCVSCIIKAPWA